MLSALKRLTNKRPRTCARRRALRRNFEHLEKRQLLAADIEFSSFFPSTEQEDGVAAIAQDSAGNAYVADYRYDSVTFEIEYNISKLSADGQLLWSQNLPEYTSEIAVDDSGIVYLASYTVQSNLPVTTDAHQSQLAGGTDFHVLVLDGNAIDADSATLSGSELIYASYLGGTGDESQDGSLAIDADGGIYLAGETYSTDFPVTSQAGVDSSLGGDRDGVVAYFARGSSGDYSLSMSSYIGGSEWDGVRALVVDTMGTIHVAGATSSDDFVVTSDAYQATIMSSGGFVARLTKDAELIYGSYFPAGVGDIAADETGNTYLIGSIGRDGFPVTEGAYAPPEILADDGLTRLNGNYVSKIATTGELEHSSWYQLSKEVTGLTVTSITLDGNRPVITGAQRGGPARSVHLLRFAEDFSGLLDSSIVYVETAPGFPWISPSSVIDGHVYVAGSTSSSDFETTADALFPSKNIGADGYLRRYTFGDVLPPTITPQVVPLNEGVSAGAAFAVMDGQASLPDQTLTFSITGGNTAGAFTINAATGKVTLNNPGVLDFTNYEPTVLAITVTDDQSPPQSNSATLTIQPFQPTQLAGDTFDSRRFDQDEGWIESEWQTTNYTYLVDGYNDDGNNYAGTMLQDDKGLLQRSLDTAGYDSLKLSYWTKLKSLESGDRGLVQVSSDGVNWQTIRTHTNGEDDNTWRQEQIEFATPGDRTYIRFDAEMSQSGRWWRPNYDYWYVDEIVVDGIDLADRSPLGLSDSFSVDENGTLAIGGEGVLANDVDPDGDAISAVLVAGPTNGSLNLASDGSFVYSPTAGFSGMDQFSYLATEGDLYSEVTTVSINVVGLPNNGPPVANDDSGTTDEDTPTTIDVLANDTDPENDTLSIVSLTQPMSGVATLNGAQIEYSPDANFHGTHSFTYTIEDSAGQQATATVSLSVAAVNDAPAAIGDSATTEAETAVTIDVLANDSDLDGDALTADLVSGPSHGMVTLNADSSFTYTPTTGFSGSDSFEYRAVDPAGATSQTLTVSLTVTPVDLGPNLSHGVVEDVTGAWQTVSFDTTYNSAIVVGTPQYDSNSGPGVVRVRNVTSTSFEVRVDDVGSSPFSGNVHFVALEEGVYDEPGFKLEARKLDTSVTSRRGSWAINTIGYQQPYSSPVVVGQVMSANDEDWSVFWSSSSSRTSPANSSGLNVGRHVGEDTDRTRAGETLGFFVIEATQDGMIGDLPFVAGVGSDSVRGVDNGTNQYTYDPMPNAKTAVLGMAGMDGNDGGWPVLRGDNALPASSGTIDLSVDEDQIRDNERKHSTEQVAYFVIDPPLASASLDGSSVESNAAVRPIQTTDVNGNGTTSALDALLVINHLNRNGVEEEDMALDTNGDESITALDALRVINQLNRQVHQTSPSPAEPMSAIAIDKVLAGSDDDDESVLDGIVNELF